MRERRWWIEIGRRLVPPTIMVAFGVLGMALSEIFRELEGFYQAQCGEWGLLAHGVELMHAALRRELRVGDRQIVLQCNPQRIVSTAANLSPQEIRNRACFLCRANRPAEQRDFDLGDGFSILCNPRPIFERHFTVSYAQHVPQDGYEYAKEFLSLVTRFGDEYCVFYNGALAGASAPDHLHFQMCPIGSFPLVSSLLADGGDPGIGFGLRSGRLVQFVSAYYVLFRSESLEKGVPILREALKACYNSRLNGDGLLNVVSWRQSNQLFILVIPRKAHRASSYSAREGHNGLIISPAAVEMCGVMVMPREEDYRRVVETDIANIFEEVGVGESEAEQVLAAAG